MQKIVSSLAALALVGLVAGCGGLPSNGVAVFNAKGNSLGAKVNTTTGEASVGWDAQELALIYSPNSAGPESGLDGEGKQLIDGTRGADLETRAAITVTQGDAGANILEERAGLRFESIVGTGFAARATACAIFAAASDVDPSPGEC